MGLSTRVDHVATVDTRRFLFVTSEGLGVGILNENRSRSEISIFLRSSIMAFIKTKNNCSGELVVRQVLFKMQYQNCGFRQASRNAIYLWLFLVAQPLGLFPLEQGFV